MTAVAWQEVEFSAPNLPFSVKLQRSAAASDLWGRSQATSPFPPSARRGHDVIALDATRLAAELGSSQQSEGVGPAVLSPPTSLPG